MDRIIEKKFTERVLKHQGERMLRNQSLAIEKKLRFRTGHLERGRQFQVKESDDLDGTLRFTHADYQRFLDMKRDVKMKNGKGIRRKRGYQIHNRFVFGTLYAIARELSTGLTERIVKEIQEELNRDING